MTAANPSRFLMSDSLFIGRLMIEVVRCTVNGVKTVES